MKKEDNALRIYRAYTDDYIKEIRVLFLEYAHTRQFDAALGNFAQELLDLPGEYAPPEGCLLIAHFLDEPAGCVGLRKLDRQTCEMKRLFVREVFRGKKVGSGLAREVIEAARNMGYRKIRLDTHPGMKEAQKLYGSLGFKEIPAYWDHPISSAKFYEMDLTD